MEKELADALRGMMKFWRKWPAFVPSPEFFEQTCEAVRKANEALTKYDAATPICAGTDGDCS